MLKTQNYGFNKPELSDSPPDITVMNPNWDNIDKKIKENTDAIAQNSEAVRQCVEKMIFYKPIPTGITKISNLSEPSIYQLYEAHNQFIDFPTELKDRGLVYGHLEVKNAGYVFYKMRLSNASATLETELIGFLTEAGVSILWRETPNVNNISNPSLNINPDFRIWQRGTSFDFTSDINGALAYTADRWRTSKYMHTISKNADGSLKMKRTVAGGYTGIAQVIEGEYGNLKGKKVTLSVNLDNKGSGRPYIHLICKVKGIDTSIAIRYGIATGTYSITGTIPIDIDKNTLTALVIAPNTDFEIDIYYVKLELGEIATPLSPRPYGEELELCKRYCRPLLGRYALSYYTPNYIVFINNEQKYMREIPSLGGTPIEGAYSTPGNFNVFSISGVSQSGFTLSLQSYRIVFTKNNHGLTDAGCAISDVTGGLFLDAEIY